MPSLFLALAVAFKCVDGYYSDRRVASITHNA